MDHETGCNFPPCFLLLKAEAAFPALDSAVINKDGIRMVPTPQRLPTLGSIGRKRLRVSPKYSAANPMRVVGHSQHGARG